jgi:hypothetical protein
LTPNSAAGELVRRHRTFRAAAEIAAALKFVQAGLSPTAAARQLGLERSAVYHKISRTDIERAQLTQICNAGPVFAERSLLALFI